MIRAIIIDDEEDARESLRISLQKFCKNVQIVATCSEPPEGLKAIKSEKPDLVFLDVQMPHMTGFDLLEKIPSPDFKTIFVTAHDKYAIKAIRFSALDYLLKPISIEELTAAVAKAEDVVAQKPQQNLSEDYQGLLNNAKSQMGQTGKLAVPTSEGLLFLDIAKIVYCEAEGSYTYIHLAEKVSMLVSKSLKDFANILDKKLYCRVHHSFLINLNHVEKYIKGEGGYVIMSNGKQVDISRRKKEEFMSLISRI